MTNRAAIGLFLFLLLIFAVAAFVFDDPHIFIGRKLIELIQWVAFWR